MANHFITQQPLVYYLPFTMSATIKNFYLFYLLKKKTFSEFLVVELAILYCVVVVQWNGRENIYSYVIQYYLWLYWLQLFSTIAFLMLCDYYKGREF